AARVGNSAASASVASDAAPGLGAVPMGGGAAGAAVRATDGPDHAAGPVAAPRAAARSTATPPRPLVPFAGVASRGGFVHTRWFAGGRITSGFGRSSTTSWAWYPLDGSWTSLNWTTSPRAGS